MVLIAVFLFIPIRLAYLSSRLKLQFTDETTVRLSALDVVELTEEDWFDKFAAFWLQAVKLNKHSNRLMGVNSFFVFKVMAFLKIIPLCGNIIQIILPHNGIRSQLSKPTSLSHKKISLSY